MARRVTKQRPPQIVIRELRERAELSLSEMSRRLQYKTPSGYQRYEDPDVAPNRRPGLPFVRKFAAVVIGRGHPPIDLPDLFPLLDRQPRFSTPAEKMAAYDMIGIAPPADLVARLSNQRHRVRRLGVVGEVRASFWMPAAPSIDEPLEFLPIPASDDDEMGRQYAVRIAGSSMNRVAAEGTFAICERYGEGMSGLEHGRIVHVERMRGGEVEWILKRLRWTAAGAELWPESTDPNYQTPVQLGGSDEGTQVRVLGIVVGFYQKV